MGYAAVRAYTSYLRLGRLEQTRSIDRPQTRAQTRASNKGNKGNKGLREIEDPRRTTKTSFLHATAR
jgi:hypothetical protein